MIRRIVDDCQNSATVLKIVLLLEYSFPSLFNCIGWVLSLYTMVLSRSVSPSIVKAVLRFRSTFKPIAYQFTERETADRPVELSDADDVEGVQADRVPHANMRLNYELHR